MRWRLQPYVPEAATLRSRGCNPTFRRLQPYVPEAATACVRGGNPTCQVREETGVLATLEGVVSLRHSHGFRFGQGDLYVVVKLRVRA